MHRVADAPGGADALSIADGFGDYEDENPIYYTYAVSFRDLATDQLKLVYQDDESAAIKVVTLDSHIGPDAVLGTNSSDSLETIAYHPAENSLHGSGLNLSLDDYGIDEGTIATRGGTDLSLFEETPQYPAASSRM